MINCVSGQSRPINLFTGFSFFVLKFMEKILFGPNVIFFFLQYHGWPLKKNLRSSRAAGGALSRYYNTSMLLCQRQGKSRPPQKHHMPCRFMGMSSMIFANISTSRSFTQHSHIQTYTLMIMQHFSPSCERKGNASMKFWYMLCSAALSSGEQNCAKHRPSIRDKQSWQSR